MPQRGGVGGTRRPTCGDIATGFVRMVMLLGGLYALYGWSGGGGNTSHRLSDSRTGALYSLDDGEHLIHESSDWAPRCSVTVAYGSGGADISCCLGIIVCCTSAYSDCSCDGGAIECIGFSNVLPCNHNVCCLSEMFVVRIGPARTMQIHH